MHRRGQESQNLAWCWSWLVAMPSPSEWSMVFALQDELQPAARARERLEHRNTIAVSPNSWNCVMMSVSICISSVILVPFQTSMVVKRDAYLEIQGSRPTRMVVSHRTECVSNDSRRSHCDSLCSRASLVAYLRPSLTSDTAKWWQIGGESEKRGQMGLRVRFMPRPASIVLVRLRTNNQRQRSADK